MGVFIGSSRETYDLAKFSARLGDDDHVRAQRFARLASG